MSSNNRLAGSFEKLNQSTGGVAGGVVAGLKSAGKAATKDVVKGVAKAPIDVLRDILGDKNQKGDGDSGIEKGQTSQASSTSSDANNQGQQAHSQLQKKIEEDRKLVAAKISQHRAVLQEERDRYEKSKQERAQEVQQEEVEKQEEKKVKIKQLEVKKKEVFAVSEAKRRSGTREGMKKKF